jgi:hypothetical protein
MHSIEAFAMHAAFHVSVAQAVVIHAATEARASVVKMMRLPLALRLWGAVRRGARLLSQRTGGEEEWSGKKQACGH